MGRPAVAADLAVRRRGRREQPADAARADGCGRHGAAHWLRGCGQPDADACRLAPARARRPIGAGREPGARRPAVADRRVRARGHRRRRRHPPRLLDDPGAAGAGGEHAAAGRVRRLRPARPRVRGGRVPDDADAVRRRAGAAGRDGFHLRRAQGRRTERHAWTGAPPAARIARGRAVRARADAVGRRRPAATQLRAPDQHRPWFPRRSRGDRRGDAPGRPLRHRRTGEAVLSTGGGGCRRAPRRHVRRGRQRSPAVHPRAPLVQRRRDGARDPGSRSRRRGDLDERPVLRDDGHPAEARAVPHQRRRVEWRAHDRHQRDDGPPALARSGGGGAPDQVGRRQQPGAVDDDRRRGRRRETGRAQYRDHLTSIRAAHSGRRRQCGRDDHRAVPHRQRHGAHRSRS